jgi:hypothetical protein
MNTGTASAAEPARIASRRDILLMVHVSLAIL